MNWILAAALLTAAAPAQPPPETSVEVVVETSRARSTLDFGFGIQASLRNARPDAIWIRASDVHLVVPPEIRGAAQCIVRIPAVFAGEAGGGWIRVPPGERLIAFWDLALGACPGATPPDRARSGWLRFLELPPAEELKFSPGVYNFSIQGRYARSAPPGDGGAPELHLFDARAPVEVMLSMPAIFWGAFVGGVIAVWLRLVATSGLQKGIDRMKSLSWSFAGAGRGTLLLAWGGWRLVSAGFMSSILTILVSRLGDSQLPIRIDVKDFWGAIATGVILNFASNRLLDWLAALAEGRRNPG